MIKAKTDPDTHKLINKELKLYVWTPDQIQALNYYLDHRPPYPQWTREYAILNVQRNYPRIETSNCIAYTKHTLGPYILVKCMFYDRGVQHWLTTLQLEPICNVTSWANKA